MSEIVLNIKSEEKIELSVGKEIYVEKNGQLKLIKGVKIIWSNFRQNYKLIVEDDILVSTSEKGQI
jgi:hypothetical protein